MNKLDVALKEGFKDGPCVKALDNVLASFHVKRQAYYSGTFVRNHVHRALKVTTYVENKMIKHNYILGQQHYNTVQFNYINCRQLSNIV